MKYQNITQSFRSLWTCVRKSFIAFGNFKFISQIETSLSIEFIFIFIFIFTEKKTFKCLYINIAMVGERFEELFHKTHIFSKTLP